MRSEAYWAKRMDDLNEAMLAKGEEYIRTQNEEYEKALAKIQKQTETWYARLAKNNNVSMAEARKLLKANELREFKWTVEEYIKAGRENAVDQRWMKELENASAKVHITRLEELQTHLRNEIEQLAAKRQKGTTATLGDIYKDSYYRSIYELQKGAGVGSSFAALDDRQIDKVLAKPWAPDGSNFSARIWADRTKLVAELQKILTQDLIRGEPSDRVISDFADRMGVHRRDAERLIRTESAYFSGQSRLDAYKELGVERYKFVATLDKRTSDQCRRMDGEVIPVSEAQAGVNYPPLHVYCRSTTIPYYEDAAPGERAARDGGGKTYMVPGNMTYAEWERKHAPRNASDAPDPETPKPVTPPQVRQAEPFSPAKTLDEAEEYAKRELGFEEVNYTGMHLDSANDINRAIGIALTEFPGLKGFTKKLSVSNTEEFVAQAGLYAVGNTVESRLEVSVYYYNPADIGDIIKASVDSQHWPPGSNPLSVIIHEFGHLAEYAHALQLLGVWPGTDMDADEIRIAFTRINRNVLSLEIVAEALQALGLPNTEEIIRQYLSGYATVMAAETLAEAVAEAVGTDNPRALAREILRILKRKFQEVRL
ncbi:minor capsid protein [Cohnella algarum]|uniref:minor capsid protein n=1 Tax=Cohnella algarum TaxID=2044859 RepID=UPI001966EDF6|nr:minor capsid protein [Cohnella algarum]MBN2980129.1 minor capsid protein [Cohnella algarum]